MEKILMAVAQPQIRDTICQWPQEKYLIEIMENPDNILSKTFDLCIIDFQEFVRCRPIIQKLNNIRNNPPKFLILIDRIKVNELTRDIHGILDDICYLPLEMLELDLRLSTQLRLRSFELKYEKKKTTGNEAPENEAEASRRKAVKSFAPEAPEILAAPKEQQGTASDKPKLQILDLPAAIQMMGGKEKILKKVCDSFIAELPKKIEVLKRSIVQGDFIEAQRMAHDLKTGARCVCAEQAAQISFQVETLSRKKSHEKIKETLPELEKAFNTLLHELRAYRNA
jgi:HPt (histidine-containing phosphotransfer) domain-containing protein